MNAETKCCEFRPDHNGECLSCDEWADAHDAEALERGEIRARLAQLERDATAKARFALQLLNENALLKNQVEEVARDAVAPFEALVALHVAYREALARNDPAQIQQALDAVWAWRTP